MTRKSKKEVKILEKKENIKVKRRKDFGKSINDFGKAVKQ